MIRTSNFKHTQRGISIVIVLFLLLVVSGLLLSMTQITTTQKLNTASSYLGSKYYFAAHAGLGYAIARVAGGNGCAIDSPVPIAMQPPDSINVFITCVMVGTYNEGNAAIPYSVYQLTSRVSAGIPPAASVINRQVRATVHFP